MSGKVLLTCPHCGCQAPFDLDELMQRYMERLNELLRELDEVEREVTETGGDLN